MPYKIFIWNGIIYSFFFQLNTFYDCQGYFENSILKIEDVHSYEDLLNSCRTHDSIPTQQERTKRSASCFRFQANINNMRIYGHEVNWNK